MSKKKPNPRKVPATQADVDKAKREGHNTGITLAMAIMFTAILDKGFVERERIPDLWNAVQYVSQSIIDGYVNVYDQLKMLEEEYGIEFSKLE